MPKRVLLGSMAVLLLVTPWTPRAVTTAPPPAPGLTSLAGVYTAVQGAVRDSNGDGLPDIVAARVILPDVPTLDDIEAAANIAGRLGFETTALSLPLVIRESEVQGAAAIDLPILVGRTGRHTRALIDSGAIDAAALRAGQGLIQLVPRPLGGGDGLVVFGGDDAGTLAAAIELAARLPRLWSMSGITLGGIEEQVTRCLSRSGIEAASHVVSLVVDAERRGIARVGVRVDVAPSLVARSLALLEGVDAAHRRGQQGRVIDFAEAAVTEIELVAGHRRAGLVRVHRSGLNSRTLTPPVDPDEYAPEPPARGGPAEPRLAPAKPFDLTTAFSIEGWFGDAYQDLIPDRTETTVVLGDAQDAIGAAHIAARLALETTGVTLPMTKRDDAVKEPGGEASPILVGRTNRLTQQLVKIGKARLDDLHPGEGVVQIVPRAFGNATATVVAGADAAGTLAASTFLARRAPSLWDNRRGALTFDDVVTDAARFLSARSGAGQSALALQELRGVLDEVAGKPIESFAATVFLERGDPALDAHLVGRLQAALGTATSVTVKSQGITDPSPVFEDTTSIPWEVDEFWKKFDAELLPKIKPGSTVELETRLSEPSSIRADIATRARERLVRAGAAAPRVRVLSAYKQGYCWLVEQVVPALRTVRPRSIHVRIAAHKPDLTRKYKFYTLPTRWLHELYPVDEIVQRELGIPRTAFTMELVEGASQTYALEARDARGRIVYQADFSPKVAEREYLDRFPGWSKVEVTTGWLTASVDGQTVVDGRILTDPERFWDRYQGTVLPKVYDHVMKVTGGKPTSDKQPFFRDLDVEVWMSEPDERIGIDEELLSSLEALHEDLYFVTLDFFAAMGRTLTKNRLNAPGKIFPIIHPSRTGQGASSRIVYAGNASTKARIDVTYREKGTEKPVQISRDLPRIDATAPLVVRTVVRQDGVSEIELQVDAKDDKEAARAVDALDSLSTLQASGLFRTTLSFDHVDRITIAVVVDKSRARRVIAHTGTSMPSPVRAAASRPASPVVTWDHIIGPEESERIVAGLGAFPEVRSYKVGQSYRGRDISAMEITLPTPSELVSLAKSTALKPTLLLMGRQHANEVSSTSHILRLAELLVTDASYRQILKKVNVVLCPVMNPDGAAMAYELQKLTPTHMLHAGRYSALGMDVSSRTGGLLPEAEVEGRLWRTWLPDIYLNPHGYPSHEWVQPFSGYVPPGFRAYWSSRGWYTMLSGLRDPRHPEHTEATRAIREAIVREVNRNPDVRAMNLRHQARYERWAHGYAPHVFSVEVYKDTMIYYSDPETGEPRGSRRAAPSPFGPAGRRAAISAWPQVTFLSGMTEAPDETAQGEWLTLVTRAGFSFLMAHVTYLQEGRYRIERIEEGGTRDSASLTMLRVRPVMPAK